MSGPYRTPGEIPPAGPERVTFTLKGYNVVCSMCHRENQSYTRSKVCHGKFNWWGWGTKKLCPMSEPHFHVECLCGNKWLEMGKTRREEGNRPGTWK